MNRKILTIFKFLKRCLKLDKKKVNDFLITSNVLCGGFNHKKILEVGCGTGALSKSIATTFKPVEVIGLDPACKDFEISSNCRLVNGDIRDTPFEDNYFDIIISNFSFEHVQNFDIALKEMYRVTKKEGFLYSQWGPIWSAPHGHHLWYRDPDSLKLYNYQNFILPPFCHLLMSKKELYDYIIKNHQISEKLSNNIVDYIFFSKDQNKLFYEDYHSIINNSQYNILFLKGISSDKFTNIYQKNIEPYVFEKLLIKYPDCSNFMHNGMTMLLKK